MAKSRFIQNNFVSGELSPLLQGRNDLQQYYAACETAENVVIVPQGGLRRRPGTRFITETTPPLVNDSYTGTCPNGGDPAILGSLFDTPTTSSTTPIGTTNDYVFVTGDRGPQGNNVVVVDFRRVSLSTGSSDQFQIQYSDDNVNWTLGAQIPEITTTPQDFRFYIDVDVPYWRVVRVGTDDLGSAVITAASFLLNQDSGQDHVAKLDDFSVEDDRHYLIEFTEDNIAIFRSQVVSGFAQTTRVADVRPTYEGFLQTGISNIRTAQVENVMVVVGESFAPMRLVNLGDDETWFCDEVPFLNVPQFDYDDEQSTPPVDDIQVMTLNAGGGGGIKEGDRFIIDVESVQSKSITFAGDDNADEQAATVFNIQKNLQEMPVFASTGVSVARTGALSYTITVGGASAKNFELFSGYFVEGDGQSQIGFVKTQNGTSRKEDVWSVQRGWPKTICFYEGRMVFGGTRSKPQSIFFSKSGDFFNFDTEDTDDDDGIFATISSRKLNDIVDVYPGRNLQVFTSGAEFAVTSKPVTPANVQITPQTAHGTKNIQVEDVDGSTIFIDRYGKSVLTFLYSFNEDAYTSNDQSILASHLINNPVDLALLKGTASDDANWLFIVNENGEGTILNTLRSQDINGYTSWKMTNGAIQSVDVVDDQLYMTVQRAIDGAPKLYIERWDFNDRVDSAVVRTPDGVTGQITGLEHLEGETVTIYTSGGFNDVNENYVIGSYPVANGQLVLPLDNVFNLTSYVVGLPFTPRVKTMPLNTNIGSGENQMRLKKIIRMNLRVYESFGIYINGQPVPIREFGEGADSPLVNNSIVPKTGIIDDWFDDSGWGRQVNPEITCPDPTPFQLQMIEYEIEGN